MTNMYQQINEMDLQELEFELFQKQEQLLASCDYLDEVWQYHPGNEDFVNPIKEYDDLKVVIKKLEAQIESIENKIKHLKSIN